MDITKYKEDIILAAEKAVKHLIKVAEEKIIVDDQDGNLSADRLKNAAATKKLAIFDAFEILSRIESERNLIDSSKGGSTKNLGNFAESRAK
jgi:hypothetical protein